MFRPSQTIKEAASYLEGLSSMTLTGEQIARLSRILRSHALMYELYDNRGWGEQMIQSRVGSGDQVALEFAQILMTGDTREERR